MTTSISTLARAARVLVAFLILMLALMLVVTRPAPVGATGLSEPNTGECEEAEEEIEGGDEEDGSTDEADAIEEGAAGDLLCEDDDEDEEDDADFDDVSPRSGHIEGIEWLAELGISKGCGEGKGFCPNKPVTRAEMATFLYRLSGSDPNTPPSLDALTLSGKSAADYEAEIADLESRIAALEALVQQAAQ